MNEPDDGTEEKLVLVVETLGAPHPSRRRRERRSRRAKSASSPPPLPDVPLTRATIAGRERFADEKQAKAWLEATIADPARRAERAREALDVLNRGLGALREAAEDPLVGEASFHHAIVVRVGYGSGDQIADGLWTEAREMPETPSPRHEDLDAQRRAALQLAGIDPDADPEEDEG